MRVVVCIRDCSRLCCFDRPSRPSRFSVMDNEDVVGDDVNLESLGGDESGVGV